ncbi:MAG: hypothetical protein ACO2PM_04605 [Pyrobaculum sp.]
MRRGLEAASWGATPEEARQGTYVVFLCGGLSPLVAGCPFTVVMKARLE